MPDLCFEHVCKSYGEQLVLVDFSLCLPAGGVTALMGPSGSGKTTLARLLLGLEAPDEGRITGAEGLRFSCVFQEDRLCPGLSAVDNVRLVLPRSEHGRALSALAALGLSGSDLVKPAAELSGGQKRRAALARAMEAPGEYVVLDEAFKGLDEDTRTEAFAYIRASLRGRGLLLITHDAAEAAALGGNLVTLRGAGAQPVFGKA